MGGRRRRIPSADRKIAEHRAQFLLAFLGEAHSQHSAAAKQRRHVLLVRRVHWKDYNSKAGRVLPVGKLAV